MNEYIIYQYKWFIRHPPPNSSEFDSSKEKIQEVKDNRSTWQVKFKVFYVNSFSVPTFFLCEFNQYSMMLWLSFVQEKEKINLKVKFLVFSFIFPSYSVMLSADFPLTRSKDAFPPTFYTYFNFHRICHSHNHFFLRKRPNLNGICHNLRLYAECFV